jgi:hydrogenase maturation protease
MSCEHDGTLIIGYGNRLRGDDGAGVEAAIALREAGVPAREVHQLVPELAENLSAADRVIFIDADAALAPGEVRVDYVDSESGGIFEHHATPANLLCLAREIYGRAPEAVVIGIGGASHDFGAEMSPSVRTAIGKVVELCMNPVWWRS